MGAVSKTGKKKLEIRANPCLENAIMMVQWRPPIQGTDKLNYDVSIVPTIG